VRAPRGTAAASASRQLPEAVDRIAAWRQVALLSLAETLAMGLWFSASAVAPQLVEEWGINGAQQAWLIMAVQLGFVLGALASSLFSLADRLPAARLFAVSALAAAVCNAAIPVLDSRLGTLPIAAVLLLRLLTGVFLAGVYPPGMKIVATWLDRSRGLGIGVLVGALTLGSAGPHLLSSFSLPGQTGLPPWPAVMLVASALATAAALVAGLLVHEGPLAVGRAPFDPQVAWRLLADRPVRLANFGYLGHMWELYAVWAWMPAALLVAYGRAGLSPVAARLAGFAVIAVGAVGCVTAGALADRLGRSRITIWSLAVSGTCCLFAGMLFDAPGPFTALCIVWGVAVVADSAQFSAAISELVDARWVGTALTLQTCLGFLLTLLSLRLIPVFLGLVGWRWVFLVLAPGPLAGIIAMIRLRRDPASLKMAGGRR